MNWTIPGTLLQIPKEDAAHIPDQFRAMFLGGGIVLSQVCAITGLEPYMVQNWVKRGFLTPPQNKHYTLRQLCRIINIQMLKGVLPMDRICGLLAYVNGHLDDDSDDIIDDSDLYFMFVQLAAHADQLHDPARKEQLLNQVMEKYEEPVPGAKARVQKALSIMLTAWLAARLRQETEKMLESLEKE